ncbi:MAG: hypothetical protein ABI208_09445 [Ginsengibacter sp.]|jgi:hypothetical protein
MKYLISFAFVLLLTAASCKKNNITEQLPPETHEGKFTFGCKVDGKIYTAQGKGGLLGFDHVYYVLGSSDNSISIGAGTSDNSKAKFNVFFKINYADKIGIYLMKIYPYEGIFYNDSDGTIPDGSNTFTTSEAHVGTVNIKYFNGSYNPYNKGTILSGTFEMDAVNAEGKVIHITEGRFDIGQ